MLADFPTPSVRPVAFLLAGAAACFGSTPVFAQETPGGRDDFHGRATSEIVVTASGLRQLDVVAGTSVVEGEELQRNLSGQIGEILDRQPGVSATGFSPGASAPVLRGFQGARVAVLNDGLGVIDASGASADHAVAIDPLNAQRVEVLRGPAALLYGSQAIGGAVNVVGKRIPARVPDEPLHADGRVALDSAASLREGAVSFDLPAGANVALHMDGSWRRTGNLEIGGHVLTRAARAALLEEAAEEPDEAEHLAELANRRDVLPDSATRSWALGAGGALFVGESSIGFSVNYYDTRYGVPTRPGAKHHHHAEDHAALATADEDHAEDEVPVSIDLQSLRADLRGDLALGGGFFSNLRLRAGYTDYKHVELEGDAIGTRFFVDGREARLELVQTPRGEWRGSLGAQWLRKNFRAVGPEAVAPPHQSENVALFALQEFPLGPIEVELAGRYEHARVQSALANRSRSFDAFSGALGMAYAADSLRFGFTLSRAVRAPDGLELFANGPHIATQQFEIGNADLRTEKANGIEAYVRGTVGPFQLGLSAYRTWFRDYISLQNSGEEEDGLPVYRVLQGNARYSGVEGRIAFPFYQHGDLQLSAELQGDYIHAELRDGTPLPRIPPVSLLGALEAKTPRVDARVEVQWFARQNRLAPFETSTRSFAEVNASIAFHPMAGRENITLLAQIDNLFDVTGRRHASFTKDFVPMAGRNFKLSAHFSF